MAKKPEAQSQAEKFKQAAREAGAELDAESFDKVLGSVGRTPPKTEAEARKEAGKPPR